MNNYRDILISRAAALSDEHAPLSPAQFKNKQALEAWKRRWGEHHKTQEKRHG